MNIHLIIKSIYIINYLICTYDLKLPAYFY